MINTFRILGKLAKNVNRSGGQAMVHVCILLIKLTLSKQNGKCPVTRSHLKLETDS